MDFKYLTQSGVKDSMGKLSTVELFWIKKPRGYKLFIHQNLIIDLLNMKTFSTKLMPPIDWPFALDAFKCVGNSK